MKFNMSHNIDSVLRKLDALPDKQIPYMVSRALNNTALAVKGQWATDIKRDFVAPTPYTQKSPMVTQRATKQKLEATIKIRDEAAKGTPPAKYLQPQVHGGSRTLKRFERALVHAGIMGKNEYAVPGEGIKLDAHGNIRASEIVRILAYLRAFGEQGYSANTSDEKRKRMARNRRMGTGYFVVRGTEKDGHLRRGIYQRFHLGMGTAIKPVIMFVNDVRYTSRFDPMASAEKVADKVGASEVRSAVDEALRTMR